jgi:hypothetical protein
MNREPKRFALDKKKPSMRRSKKGGYVSYTEHCAIVEAVAKAWQADHRKVIVAAQANIDEVNEQLRAAQDRTLEYQRLQKVLNEVMNAVQHLHRVSSDAAQQIGAVLL